MKTRNFAPTRNPVI